MKTRDQAIVSALAGHEALQGVKDARYTVSLPGMLMRHGLLQTLAFLLRKAAANDGDEATANTRLLHLLARGVAAQTGEDISFANAAALNNLAARPLHAYLYLNEAALLTATWIKRLSEAEKAVAEAEKEVAKAQSTAAGAPHADS